MASKKQIKQYEIYLVDLNPTKGSDLKKTRPVVIISKNDMNKEKGSSLLLTNSTLCFYQLASWNILSDSTFERTLGHVNPITQWLSSTNRAATSLNVGSDGLFTRYIPNRGMFSVE